MMVALASLLTACGDARADPDGPQASGTPDAQQTDALSSTSWLAFSDRDKCELAPQAAKVVEAMMHTGRDGEPSGMLVSKPASATLPGGGAPIRAAELADDPYQSPGVFLPLEQNWNGLPLRGLWANSAARAALTGTIPYDGVEIRLYFADTPELVSKLESAGWTLSEVDPEHDEAMPVATFSQQYYLDGDQKLLAKPIDYDAEANRSASGIPEVDGRQIGTYAMNTVVQLVKSSAKPGMTYLTCNIYAST
ncbi:hypothetical protein [Alteriqipengyuania sp. 357]